MTQYSYPAVFSLDGGIFKEPHEELIRQLTVFCHSNHSNMTVKLGNSLNAVGL